MSLKSARKKYVGGLSRLNFPHANGEGIMAGTTELKADMAVYSASSCALPDSSVVY